MLIIDCATNEVLGSFHPRGQRVGGISLNPDGTTLFCWSDPPLLVDCATDSVVAELDGVRPRSEGWRPAAVWSHDNRRIYVNIWNLGVLVVDAVNNTVIDSIWTGNNTTDVLMHPTADRVYVTNVYSSSLTVIRDGVGIVEHPGRPVTTRGLPMPTVVRGVLFLPEASSHKLQAASLLDVAGRKVLDLKAGANDVSRLAPGVYFVRQEPQASSHKLQAVDKVIITR